MKKIKLIEVRENDFISTYKCDDDSGVYLSYWRYDDIERFTIFEHKMDSDDSNAIAFFSRNASIINIEYYD